MLTGKAAEIRPDINYLRPRTVVLVTPEQARADAYAAGSSAENAETLKARGRMANLRHVTTKRVRDREAAHRAAERGTAWIPTSGAARRRAKANRNRDAVNAMTARWADAAARRRQHGDDLLAEVLAWCSAHPHDWSPLPASGPLQMNRDADGAVTVEGDAPEFLAVSAHLLTAASPDYLSFTDGVLTVAVQPAPLHYRPLGPDPASFTVVFERIREA